MVYTELTNKAMRFAYAAHHGQVDYNGIPYIFHPIHLAESMDDEISCCAALLHDVVEDTEVTMEELAKEFPPEVVEVVTLLTHNEDTESNNLSYFDYVRANQKAPNCPEGKAGGHCPQLRSIPVRRLRSDRCAAGLLEGQIYQSQSHSGGIKTAYRACREHFGTPFSFLILQDLQLVFACCHAII